MRIISSTMADGIVERHFTLDDIPGVLWSPAQAGGDRPVVLLAHGGGQHKQSPGLVARAHAYVTGSAFTVVAIDAPGHGDRPKTEPDVRFVAEIRERMAAGAPLAEHVARYNAQLADRAVPEWQTVIDALYKVDGISVDSGIGFWGVSMGTAIGVPLLAVEPRIRAAVLGLAGDGVLTAAARRIAVPIQFLLQWDDQLVPRAEGLALFEAFASAEKTLHANPGRHAEVPEFELEDSARFFARHLSHPRPPAPE